MIAAGRKPAQDKSMIILGIETSCDETGVAVYDTASPGAEGLRAQALYSHAGKQLRLSWYPGMVAIGGEPGIAYSSGPALYEDLAPDSRQRFRIGEFQSIWHRDADGAWRVLFDDGIEPRPASDAEVAAFRAGRREDCPRG